LFLLSWAVRSVGGKRATSTVTNTEKAINTLNLILKETFRKLFYFLLCIRLTINIDMHHLYSLDDIDWTYSTVTYKQQAPRGGKYHFCIN